MSAADDRAQSAPYSVGATVRVTGLSEHTLRAWERRYAAVEPLRTEGGTRRYTQCQIDRLLLLKRAVDAGHRIGAIAHLDDGAVAALLGPAEEPYGEPISEILSAVERFDARDVERRLAMHFSALGPEAFAQRIALPLLREVGDRWERGEMGPAAEHLTSGVTRSLLSLALRERPALGRAGTIVCATPAGERHEFGLLVSAILAAAEGYEVIYLGVDLPVDEIALAAERSRADVIVLALTGAADKATSGALRKLRSGVQISTEIWIGGAGVEFAERDKGIEKINDWNSLKSYLRRRQAA
jgi:DNA-binding transcriptional MerR regulator/methylmalonyl-CoA mutase cobalamin-binding subunit